MSAATDGVGRRVAERIEVVGIVQGVGFRPFVHRLAVELGLDGVVGNDSSRVFVDVAGPSDRIDELVRRLVDDAPPLADVQRIRRSPSTAAIRPGFRIVASARGDGARTLVPPDTAVCDDCLRELFDPGDRRHRHPFITCTNCGPRFTIIRDLPYDRPATTMAGFAMCAACAAEYADPGDRRYHAQPIACHDCGPTLALVEAGRRVPGEAAVARAVELLAGGAVVAIKGLGGYHLACDATRDEVVADLRRRKQRPDKPFAAMVGDPDAARRLAAVSDAELAQLVSPARPVVLLRRASSAGLAAGLAPGNPLVGLMLAYTPVHHLLFAAGVPPLVMTSGNVSGEPIVHRDDEVEERLGHLCDAVLGHDRPIHVPCDDSVVRVVDDALLPIRRARGYAPVPVPLRGGRRRVLAVGGELKNTCCIATPDRAWVSQHVGDMQHLPSLTAFESIAAQFRTMYDVEPDVVAADAHPDYTTTRWAHRHHAGRVVEVQHHHAHVAAVMAEHDLDPHRRVIGIAFDGTGYGSDGAIWGGEVLLADATGFDRVAHLADVPLPGGDAAIRHPARVALAHLDAVGIGWTPDLAPVQALDEVELGLLRRQLSTGFGCVPTSSMGRFFDAVASVLGLRHRISYEAQAAIELEVAASSASTTRARRYRFEVDGVVCSPAALWRAVVDDVRSDVDVASIARGVHLAVADLVAELAERSRAATGIGTVALSGGVFQNALLSELVVRRLEASGFRALTHRRVPPNDGGLALGQAYVAAHSPDPLAPGSRPAAPTAPTDPIRPTHPTQQEDG